MRDHVDGLHREIVEANSRVEHNFVKKSSFELLQDEVSQLRTLVEGMAQTHCKLPIYPSRIVDSRRDAAEEEARHPRENFRNLDRRNPGALRTGPPHPDIVATMPFPDVRFRTLLDYRLYRLADMRDDVDSYDRKMMSTKRKVMYHRMYNHEIFDGSKQVYAMRFFGIFALHCDRERVREGMGFNQFSNALKGDAQHEYMRNHQHERFLAPVFTNWPGTCHWFLTNYVTQRVLHKSIEELEDLRQSTGLSVQDYYKELQSKSKYLGEALDNSALLQIFQRGLLPTLSSEADQNYNRFTGPNAFIELRDFLSYAQETHKKLIRTARATA